MKIKSTLSLVAALALLCSPAFAKPIPGPKGGRMLTTAAPHAEFFVQPDGTVAVSFYDAELKPMAPGARQVIATAEAPTGKVRIEFTEKDGILVSNAALPAGSGYNIVVQVREAAGAKPVNYRIPYETHTCSGCNRAEYACTCEEG